MCAIEEYASIRLTLSCASATRLPSVIVSAARTMIITFQSAASGPSASANSRMMRAKAPIFGPTDR